MGNKKFYLYIDECGDQNLANFDANFPIFTLCGIIVSEENRDILDSQIALLKKEFWGDRKIILHSRDIRKVRMDLRFCLIYRLKNASTIVSMKF